MLIIAPDFDRIADLPGAGPTPRPVEIGPAETGFSDLLGLRIDELADGAIVEDAAGTEEEVLLVLLAGAVTVEVAGPQHEPEAIRLDADSDWALHLPPGSAWTLRSLAPATLARAVARGAETFAPQRIAPRDGRLAHDGPQGRLRLRLRPLEPGSGPDSRPDSWPEPVADLPPTAERLLHLGGPARVEGRELPPMHTLALSPGERARLAGQGELLALAAGQA